MPDAVNLARLLREFKKATVACLLSFFSITLSLVCTRLFAGRVQVMYEKFMIQRMKNRPMSQLFDYSYFVELPANIEIYLRYIILI